MRADHDFAALDLGSNSFHLLLARRVGGHFETVERAKEKVQLLAGFADGRLHPDALAPDLLVDLSQILIVAILPIGFFAVARASRKS